MAGLCCAVHCVCFSWVYLINWQYLFRCMERDISAVAVICNHVPPEAMLAQVFITVTFLWIKHLEPEAGNKIVTDMQIT